MPAPSSATPPPSVGLRRAGVPCHRHSRIARSTPMTVRSEKEGSVWTVVHDRPEARNAMDPISADALTAAFLEFDADKTASVAGLYGAGGAGVGGGDRK